MHVFPGTARIVPHSRSAGFNFRLHLVGICPYKRFRPNSLVNIFVGAQDENHAAIFDRMIGRYTEITADGTIKFWRRNARLTVEFLVVVDSGHVTNQAWAGDVHQRDPIPQDNQGKVASK